LSRETCDVSLILLKKEINGKTKIRVDGNNILEILENHNKYFRRKVGADE
jgi:hypothetical protein